MYFDRQGQPITQEAWLRTGDADRHVAETTVAGRYWVSTIWLGLDHGFGAGPPLIFETMVFGLGSGFEDLECRRYATEAGALAGHAQVVALVEAEAAASLPEDEPER